MKSIDITMTSVNGNHYIAIEEFVKLMRHFAAEEDANVAARIYSLISEMRQKVPCRDEKPQNTG